MRFVEKLSHSRTLFSRVVISDYYKDICLSFAGQLSYVLKDYFDENVFFASKKFIMTELIFNILPCCVLNDLFCCSRIYYCLDIGLLCTRFNVKQKDTSDYINKKL